MCFAAAVVVVVAAVAAVAAVAGENSKAEEGVLGGNMVENTHQAVHLEASSLVAVAGDTLCWQVLLKVGRNYRSMGVGSAGSSEVHWGIEGWGHINVDWMHCLE